MKLSEDEERMVALVSEFVDERVRPRVREFEEDGIYPAEFIDEMKRLDEPGGRDRRALRDHVSDQDVRHARAARAVSARVHGGYCYSKEYDVERYFRDAPLMIVGEGTNEVQRNVIAAQLIARNKI